MSIFYICNVYVTSHVEGIRKADQKEEKIRARHRTNPQNLKRDWSKHKSTYSGNEPGEIFYGTDNMRGFPRSLFFLYKQYVKVVRRTSYLPIYFLTMKNVKNVNCYFIVVIKCKLLKNLVKKPRMASGISHLLLGALSLYNQADNK